jgi:hypothetical protein
VTEHRKIYKVGGLAHESRFTLKHNWWDHTLCDLRVYYDEAHRGMGFDFGDPWPVMDEVQDAVTVTCIQCLSVRR